LQLFTPFLSTGWRCFHAGFEKESGLPFSRPCESPDKGDGAVAGCAFFLVKFEKGVATPVSKKIMSSAFHSECTVELTAKNGRLVASVTSTEEIRSGDAFDYPREVRFDVPIESNSYGGTGMLFTGTVGVNSVLVTGWQASWPK
jgi:hypothetical protein